MRLAIISTHPIQYYAPVFRLLSERKNIDLKVFYTYGEASSKYDKGFNRNITWDVPLLEGYNYEYLTNIAAEPGTHHFKGISNPDLVENISAFEPNALLVYGWAYQSHLKALRYFKNRIPVIFRGDSTLLDETSALKSILRNLFLVWLYRHVNYAWYSGTNNKAYFKKYALKDNQLKFVPHSVDNDRFSTDRPEETAQLRRELNIAGDQLLILFAGKFESKKDPLLLLEMFLLINKPNAHLLFVGNGVLESELKERASGKANIHFMNFQNQSYMPVVYQAADLFCLPSKGPGETWGLAINEAMACSKAILAADKVGCAIDLVRPGYNGDIFEAGNRNDFLAKLEQLLNKERLTEMGLNSHDLIQEWSIQVQVQKMEQFLNEV